MRKTDELEHEKSIKQKMRDELDSRLYESLKSALDHQHRLHLLQGMSLDALKKIAKSESINIKGLRTKKDIIEAMLKVIESRFDSLDHHEHVYIPDEFGLPKCCDYTPLNLAYRNEP